MKSRSPAIPMMQAVRKHMENQVRTLRHRKSHCDPSKHKDVCRLENSYKTSEVHSEQQGRKLQNKSDIVEDFVMKGAVTSALKYTRRLDFTTGKRVDRGKKP